MNNESFNKYIEQAIKENWERIALSDFDGVSYHYKDIARKIAKIHLLLESAEIKKGDKIAICGKNSAHWAVAFFAAITYGAVPVPILHEFKADNIHHIVNHSEAKLLFVGDIVWEDLNETLMKNLKGIFLLNDFSLLRSKSEKLTDMRNRLNEYFGKKYPARFTPDAVSYYEDSPEELAVINYTSGSTGFSKGVMLPYRSIWSNVSYCFEMLPVKPGDHIVSMLPMGHVFGMVYDFLYGFSAGAHIYFLTRMPSPKIISQSFSEIKPRVISCVPLIVEKIIKKDILPKVDSKIGKLLLKVPIVNDKIKSLARQAAMEIFGGNFDEIIIGGAPFNAEVEAFLKKIGFPYTIAYGMTECGPIICSSRWETLKLASCGKATTRMEVRIDSPDPKTHAGEIVCRGMNMMLGYYKNPEATKEVFTEDGWLRTGDLGKLDENNNLYIRGRSKTMILSSSGQNIFPEEIEARLNNLPFVLESLIIERNKKLVALVYADYEALDSLGLNQTENIKTIMDENLKNLNNSVASYEKVSQIQLYPNEFEKTPKRSIKRYLYNSIAED